MPAIGHSTTILNNSHNQHEPPISFAHPDFAQIVEPLSSDFSPLSQYCNMSDHFGLEQYFVRFEEANDNVCVFLPFQQYCGMKKMSMTQINYNSPIILICVKCVKCTYLFIDMAQYFFIGLEIDNPENRF